MRSLSIVIAVLALAAPAAHADTPHPQAIGLGQSLSFVDEDAPVVLTVQPDALDEWMPLVGEVGAELGVNPAMLAMGAAPLLGFQPFSSEGWKSIGVNPKEPMVLQLGATTNEAADRVWRSRLIATIEDPALVRQKLSALKLGDALPVDSATNGEITFFFQRPTREAKRTRKELQDAGVFLLIKPGLTPFWIAASERDSRLVFDLIYPASSTYQLFRGAVNEWLPTIERRARRLTYSSPGATQLIGADVGLWLRSDYAGRLLSKRWADGRCRGFEKVASESHVQALSVGLTMNKGAVDGRFDVRFRKKGALDTQLRENVVDLAWPEDDQVLLKFRADFMPMLFALGLERRRGVLANWDSLTKGIRECGDGALPMTMALAWPRVLGIWLSELAALDPKGRKLMGSMVGARLVLLDDPQDQEPFLAFAETMVSGAGRTIAYDWLDLLFGHRHDKEGAMTWGRGPLRPYSVKRSSTLKGYETAGYSMLGVGYGSAAQLAGLAAKRVKDFEGGPVQLVANPREIAAHIPALPFSQLWRRWRSLRIDSVRDAQGMSFTIQARP